MTTKEHYDKHLAHFYEWMAGDFDTKQKEQQDFFEKNGIIPAKNKIAIDLGAGHGLQSISLAKLGFQVNAIDFNQQLLKSLEQRTQRLGIKVLYSDLLSETNFVETANTITCMGDTIAHLESIENVRLLFKHCFDCLEERGKLILSYRDYGVELIDTQRFIHVKSDDNKMLTCFLEYYTDRIKVTELFYEKLNGEWIQRVSSYFKLRITSQLVEQLVTESGFKVQKTEIINRMNYLIAGK
jgi:2-polyprenyl-3-methyl-5-hydroxy-6-metoxy-1,4-benzoquinol methylase